MRTQKRRRKEQKTNYHTRIKLLKSGKPRVVCRKTNKHIIAQYITSKNAQDKIELGASSKELLKLGWPEQAKGSLKSVPAAYLTGILMGNKLNQGKKDSPIIDFGMIRIMPGNKMHGFLKGIVDAGVEIKVKEEDFPSPERIKGEFLKNKIDIDSIKSKILGK